METALDVVEGCSRPGVHLAVFRDHPTRMETVIENPYILLHEKKVSVLKDLLPLLEQVAKLSAPADHRRGGGREALAALVVNKLRES